MVKSSKDMKENIREAMRGGDGRVICKDFLSKGEYDGSARLFSTLTLEPGCSIGKHVHENEEEVFYVLNGIADYDDNGTVVKMYPGDSCICRAGEAHSIANRQESGNLTVVAVILTL